MWLRASCSRSFSSSAPLSVVDFSRPALTSAALTFSTSTGLGSGSLAMTVPRVARRLLDTTYQYCSEHTRVRHKGEAHAPTSQRLQPILRGAFAPADDARRAQVVSRLMMITDCACRPRYLPFASLIARHSRSGVAGISTWRMPRCARASTSALATAGMAPTQPASPAPLTPSGLVAVGTGLLFTSTALMSVARGIA